MKPLRFDVWVVIENEAGQMVGAYRDHVSPIEVLAPPDEVASTALAVMAHALDEPWPDERGASGVTVLMTDERGPRLFECVRFTKLQFRRVD